jgi:hypothetical protein
MTVVEEACPAPEEEEYDGLAIPVDHPDHAYSDAELDSLAVSDPVAAVVLDARSNPETRAAWRMPVPSSNTPDTARDGSCYDNLGVDYREKETRLRRPG